MYILGRKEAVIASFGNFPILAIFPRRVCWQGRLVILWNINEIRLKEEKKTKKAFLKIENSAKKDDVFSDRSLSCLFCPTHCHLTVVLL